MTPSDTARICTRKGQQRRRSEQQAAGKEGSQGSVSAAGSNLDETSSREEGGQRGGRLGQKEGRGRGEGGRQKGDGWMDGRTEGGKGRQVRRAGWATWSASADRLRPPSHRTLLEAPSVGPEAERGGKSR